LGSNLQISQKIEKQEQARDRNINRNEVIPLIWTCLEVLTKQTEKMAQL